MKRLYARHRLDIKLRHLAYAISTMSASGDWQAATDVERLWSAQGAALACYSVRSGFHLLLSALALPRGSEVLFSAVTHPDMPRLAKHHGLVPVPVDLDPATLSPHPELLARAITEKSRMLVVAHLFGGRVDLAPLAEMCRRHRLVLVEDCAQSFQGPPDTGDPTAQVSMFSFGILKTATAMGGALLTVRDPALLDRMRAVQRGWPLQTRRAHLRRIVQTAAFVAFTRPLLYTAVARVSRAMGRDFDRFVNSAAHSFPAGSTEELVGRLEQRPSAPLLRFLRHRLGTFDHARLQARSASGKRLAALLPSGLHVGGFALDHSHWLFPVVIDQPDGLIDAVRAAGFDAARSASSVTAIPAPASRPDLEPRCARELLSRLVFLPAYPELPPGSLDRLSSALEGQDAHSLPLLPRSPR
ncbi:MAG: DegT/DnrJ/EryC1/StrS aminotransferase family protein [Chloroflexi bacterium]|nr:MAG: DegT/DnrJ/EryC1/StrS aminotransferase family protein [Chloroflexota bacterium]